MSEVPSNITKEHLLKAIERIDNEGIVKGSQSSTYDLLFKGKRYPPKLVVSFANVYANGEELIRGEFDSGENTPSFNLLKREAFEIVHKETSKTDVYSWSIEKIAKQFIEDAKSGNQKTKHYPKSYKGLKVKVSFGQGGLAKVPWVAFLKGGEEVQKGIYPVLHIYKNFNCLVLSYGISRNNPPLSSWNISEEQTISDYLQEKYGAPDNTYSESFICGAYEIDKELDKAKLESDMERIIKDYDNANFISSIPTISEPDSPYITEKEEGIMSPLNQILYGPPGTGKTYHTTEAAVRAASPDFEWGNDRNVLKDEYERLVLEKRIRFVTFHQSYGYEEFVEGLKARETDSGGVTYATENGVFKSICEDATPLNLGAESVVNLDGRVWKLSLEGTQSNSAKTYCLENSIAAIGWGDTGDLSHETRNDYYLSQGSNNQNTLTYFSKEVNVGDIVLCIDSNTSVEAVGVVTGQYKFEEAGLPSRNDYQHQIPIHWLSKGFSVDFKELNGNKQFNLPTCYPLTRLSVVDVVQHLAKYDVNVSSVEDEGNQRKDNYVLIIDEINRGNISKIFGELITLIEPSKRSGNGKLESLSLTLPHSGKRFSVPDNLHLIGTMNTADRSLAMMDTALRRRFDFIEMMPKPELFKGKSVLGIDLQLLLETINKRIEVLYDREHTLGHAFFMPVIEKLEQKGGGEDRAFIELQNVFTNKVVPLLEEYFFEDWEKIRLVLGDNQKKTEGYQFVIKEELDNKTLESLFGNKYKDDNYLQSTARYCLNKSAFSSEKAYKYIITGEPTDKSPDEPGE